MLDDVLAKVVTRASVVRVRTALNPLLWTLATIASGCLLSALIAGPSAGLTFIFAGLTSFLVGLIAVTFIYFMIKAPDRLQSEEFVLKQQELTLLERMGGAPVAIDGQPPDGQKPIEMGPDPMETKGDLT